MVTDDTKSDVYFLLISLFSGRQRSGIFLAAEFLEFGKNGTEDVGVVVGNSLIEIGKVVRCLNDCRNTLKTHAGVHVFGGKRRKGAVLVCVVLNEDKIPDFDALPAVSIYKTALRVASGRKVNVQLTARPARAGVAHHPKVVLLAAVDNMNSRVESGIFKDGCPVFMGFLIEFTRVALGGLINRGVKAFLRKTPCLGEEFPSPSNGVLFKIITKGPVA